MPMRTKQKFWQTKEFKELQEEWNKKLSGAGFKDAEWSLKLKQKASNSYRGANKLNRETKLRYYELLGIAFHAHVFEDPVEKLIMERKACGVTIKKISEELKILNEKRSHRETIGLIIEKYEIIWGIRKR